MVLHPLGWTALGPVPGEEDMDTSRGIRTTQAYSTTLRSGMEQGDICQQLKQAYHVEFNEMPDSDKKTINVSGRYEGACYR